MKKRVGVFIFLILVLLINMAIISTAFTVEEESEKVSLAYNCLNNAIDAKDCSRMTLDQTIFSLLAVGRCETEVYDASLNMECWPKSNCDIKITSQALLALDENSEDTTLAENWLLAHNATPTNLDWFLEIDSLTKTSCTTKHGSKTFAFNIGEDKKITLAGNKIDPCLSITSSGYWLSIDPSCYDETFTTSCDEDFLTTLLYKKKDVPTIYVSKYPHSGNAGSTTEEKINSYCFSKSGISCDYENNLWAALALNSVGREIDMYMPYLISEASENKRYSPESFLYYITNDIDYRTQILENQISGKWWQNYATNSKYYDTPLELYPFQGEDGIEEKTGTKEWLLMEVQGSDGCWDAGNIINNAFILHSIWPEYGGGGPGGVDCELAGHNCVTPGSCSSNNTLNQYDCEAGLVCCDDGFGPGNDDDDCEENGFFCTSGMNCQGEILYEFDCPGLYLCCDTDNKETTCSDLSGEICASNEYCKSGEEVSTFDLKFGEKCCVEGTCEKISSGDEYDCEENSGSCMSYCGSGYEETSVYSCAFGDTCCLSSSPVIPSKKSGGKWWIWVLFILIVVALVAVLFRDKIKEIILKIKTRKGGTGNSSMQQKRGPPYYPGAGPGNMNRPPQRRILPSQGRPMPQRRPPQRSGELNDVLKKLKDMGQ